MVNYLNRRKNIRNKNHRPSGISRGKKILLVLAGLAIIVLTELALRLLFFSAQHTSQRDPFVGFSAVNPLFVQYIADDGTVRMKTAPGKLTWFNEQDFPLEKKAGTFRIFTLGGSTTYGRPYADPTSFSGWTRALLNADGSPERHYEVINAGGISYASYRVRVIAEELLHYSPDLFIIYTGHNEFLEARTYENLRDQPSLVFKARKLLSGMKIYQILKKTIGTGGAAEPDIGRKRSILAPEVRTMLDSSAGLDLYVRDTLFSRGVFEHFRYNIRAIKRMCKQAGVPLIFLDPVDNIKDFSPFKSQGNPALSKADSARVAGLVSEGRLQLRDGRPRAAIGKFTAAAGLDSLYADHWFMLGRACLAAGDTASAAGYLLKARELDVCPLRAQSPIHRILGEEMAGADAPPLLDLPELFKGFVPGGLIGREVLIDHVHPLPESNLRIALFILEWMIDSGYADRQLYPESESRLAALTRNVYGGLPGDYARNGIVKLARVLFWSKKFAEALSVLDEQWEVLFDSPRAQFLRGELMQSLGGATQAIEHYRKAYELAPDEKIIIIELASLYNKAGMADSSEVLLKRGLEQFPDDAQILGDYGMALARKGDTDAAMRLLLKARRLEPDNANIQLNIGNVYAMSGMFQRAGQAYLESIELNPAGSDGWYNLANINYELNNPEKAEAQFLKAIELDSKNALAQLNLGNLYMETGRFQLAGSCYKMALESDPGIPATYANLVKLYLKMGDDSLAAEILAHGREKFPYNSLLKNIIPDD